MEINQLGKKVIKAVKKRYPDEWGLEDRYISLVRQIGDFGYSLHHKTGKIKKSKQHDSIQHQIACIMVDLFMFSDLLNADVEKELKLAIKWFKTGKK